MHRLLLCSASVTADLWSQKGEVFLQVSSFVLQKRLGDRQSVDGVRGGDCNSESLGCAAAGGVHSRVGKGQAEQHCCSRGLATTALATLERC